MRWIGDSHYADWSFILTLVFRILQYKHDKEIQKSNIFYTFALFTLSGKRKLKKKKS